MKLRYIIMSMVLAFLGFNANAQDNRLSLNLNYNYSFPLNSFRSDIVSKSSPRGFTGNLMYAISPKFSIGFATGYQDFYQKYDRQIYNLGKGQQVSAVLSNSLEQVPFMARAEYYPLGNATTFRPYVTLGAGGNFINYEQYLGEFGSSNSSVGFRGMAGVGVKVPLGIMQNWGIDVGGSYDFAPYHKFGMENLNTANVHAGLYLSFQ